MRQVKLLASFFRGGHGIFKVYEKLTQDLIMCKS